MSDVEVRCSVLGCASMGCKHKCCTYSRSRVLVPTPFLTIPDDQLQQAHFFVSLARYLLIGLIPSKALASLYTVAEIVDQCIKHSLTGNDVADLAEKLKTHQERKREVYGDNSITVGKSCRDLMSSLCGCGVVENKASPCSLCSSQC